MVILELLSSFISPSMLHGEEGTRILPVHRSGQLFFRLCQRERFMTGTSMSRVLYSLNSAKRFNVYSSSFKFFELVKEKLNEFGN
ncbi:hypothetical protein ACOSP7_001119 [Xanthoceras sorbifolium]